MCSVRLSKWRLCEVSMATLLIPNILFLLTWVKVPIMIICCPALIISYVLFIYEGKKQGPQTNKDHFWETSWMVILACLACAAVWTFLSGIGGFFYQNDDFYGRNAIFHDLLEHKWPVLFEGTDYALTYYIGYWIVPALIGKAFASAFGQQILWTAANYVLYFETVWFLFLIFLLFLSVLRVRSVCSACGFLLMFVLFSGMDGLACFFLNDWTDQIEWWAQTWQYSSHTTCLFWVFNQSLPAWLATLVLISMPQRVESYAFIGLSMLLFSPLPLVGFAFICFGLYLKSIVQGSRQEKDMVRKRLLKAFSPCNLLAILGSLPSFFYLASNASSGNAPFRPDMFLHAYTLPVSIYRLIIFSLVEWAVYAVILWHQWHKEVLFQLVVVSLFIIPIFRVGYHMDFCMRASIPSLLILSVYCAKHVHTGFCTKKWLSSVILLMALLIGSITPMKEFERGAYRVMKNGSNRIFSDPYKTVLHPYADTPNFICDDVGKYFFYQFLAK